MTELVTGLTDTGQQTATRQTGYRRHISQDLMRLGTRSFQFQCVPGPPFKNCNASFTGRKNALNGEPRTSIVDSQRLLTHPFAVGVESLQLRPLLTLESWSLYGSSYFSSSKKKRERNDYRKRGQTKARKPSSYLLKKKKKKNNFF